MSPAWRFSCWSKLLVIALAIFTSLPLLAQASVTIPEEIEWTWEVRPQHPDGHLPNVLLLGDSISRNYLPQVSKDLAGIANVYLLASSTCVGDPRLPHQIAEFAKAEDVRFRVVHFNNGMHGWAYTEQEYKAAFPSLVHAIRSITEKNGVLIWASTTPVRADAPNGATNPRIDERNAIALAFAKVESIPVDDQHALMLQHEDLHEDPVHFNSAGATIQGQQAAASIRSILAPEPHH